MITNVARALRRRLRDVADGDHGFSLIEVIVSFVLFSIVAAGATYGIVSSIKASHTSQLRIDAANIAQSFITNASAQGSNSLPAVHAESAHQFPPVPVGSETFIPVRWITFIPVTATQCAPGVSYTVSVTVSQSNSTHVLARSDSVVAC